MVQGCLGGVQVEGPGKGNQGKKTRQGSRGVWGGVQAVPGKVQHSNIQDFLQEV